nr:hypothetical protein [Tanacetum cinerariifolium]
MQGTSLTKHERECKLYDEFDKFAYKEGESLREFYLRFSLFLNDMNIYNMKLEQFQVNTKFLNTLPPEWSKFVTDVKLVRDFHPTNVDQLLLTLDNMNFKQMSDDPIDAINHIMSFLTAVVTSWYPPTNNQLRNSSNPRQQGINTAKVALMVNLSYYGSDDLAEVHNQDNVTHNLVNQVVQAMPLSEESDIMNQSDTKIISDTNIIPYSQYNLVNFKEPNPSTRPTQVEVPKELFKVSMVNTSLKKLKHHLASFDVVVKERTTATAIAEGT